MNAKAGQLPMSDFIQTQPMLMIVDISLYAKKN